MIPASCCRACLACQVAKAHEPGRCPLRAKPRGWYEGMASNPSPGGRDSTHHILKALRHPLAQGPRFREIPVVVFAGLSDRVPGDAPRIPPKLPVAIAFGRRLGLINGRQKMILRHTASNKKAYELPAVDGISHIMGYPIKHHWRSCRSRWGASASCRSSRDWAR